MQANYGWRRDVLCLWFSEAPLSELLSQVKVKWCEMCAEYMLLPLRKIGGHMFGIYVIWDK